ncbi:MAG: hypothetical protein K2O40_09150 [Lachnospiraceae bacterium]|nr:hypothetical protein [Lachnospiraceae bacterium]MDE7184619.1 hypothetical protein [Lachnospiraceae bacterium]
MSVSERENIHTLFLGKNYLELYKTQSKVLQAMLFVETQKEFGYCTGVCSWNAFSGFAIFKPLWCKD